MIHDELNARLEEKYGNKFRTQSGEKWMETFGDDAGKIEKFLDRFHKDLSNTRKGREIAEHIKRHNPQMKGSLYDMWKTQLESARTRKLLPCP